MNIENIENIEEVVEIIETDEYICPDPELELIYDGYKGNGCGNASWNIWLARILMAWYKVDFTIPCLIHDAARDIDYEAHGLIEDDYLRKSDEAFRYNLIIAVHDNSKNREKGEDGYSDGRLKLAYRFYQAVLIQREFL